MVLQGSDSQWSDPWNVKLILCVWNMIKVQLNPTNSLGDIYHMRATGAIKMKKYVPAFKKQAL